jgi:hypothetical protein
MLINELIARLQIIINKGIPSDDNKYSDRFIYSLLKSHRAKRIRQRLEDFKYISPFNYSTIQCLPLELGQFSDCPCFTSDCYILRSTVEIPKIIAYSNNLAIKNVTTIDGAVISETSKTKDNYKKYTKTKQNELGYFIYNKRLYITGTTKLKVVTLTAIFEEPEDLNNISACDTGGNIIPGTCYNPQEEDYPLDLDLYDDVENMILDKLFKSMESREEDNENNAKDTEITQEKE